MAFQLEIIYGSFLVISVQLWTIKKLFLNTIHRSLKKEETRHLET
jgi:hypothetical protein